MIKFSYMMIIDRYSRLLSASIGLCFLPALSACETSGYTTMDGTDIGKPDCKMLNGHETKLHFTAMKSAIGKEPNSIENCRYGDRTTETVKWKNGSHIHSTLSHGDYFSETPDQFILQLRRTLAKDISRSDIKQTQGRHNTFFYYTQSTGSNACLYFLTFLPTWSALGPEGLTMGYFYGRYCFRVSPATANDIAIIKNIGHK